MKVGIIGSGIVGQTLANGFLKHGYQVMIGTRDTSKLSALDKKIIIASPKETAQFSNILVLAVKGTAALDVLNQIGSQDLENKIIIDTTNPIANAPPENGVLKFFTSLDESLMERLQNAFPKTHLVKAFNSIGSALMVNPKLEQKPTMFICGNDDGAKKEVSKICELFGFDVADMGKVEAARAIEPLCMLWCIPGFLNHEWSHAFRLIKN